VPHSTLINGMTGKFWDKTENMIRLNQRL